MTDEEWHLTMLARLDKWLSMPRTAKPNLLKYMYMNGEDFINWRQTREVPKVTRLCMVVFDDETYNKIWS